MGEVGWGEVGWGRELGEVGGIGEKEQQSWDEGGGMREVEWGRWDGKGEVGKERQVGLGTR